MTDMPDLARCPSCQGYYDADDMTGGECPNCAGPEPVDPWAGQWVSAIHTDALIAQRDQARRFAAAWQGEAEAYRQVVEALAHEYRPRTDWEQGGKVIGWHNPCCALSLDHPVHRTVAVIQAETCVPAAEVHDAT